jgi:hypothetical protein
MLKIRVLTKNLDTGEIVGDKIIDHMEHGARVWLGKHCYWAFRNNHGVQTWPVTDDDAE